MGQARTGTPLSGLGHREYPGRVERRYSSALCTAGTFLARNGAVYTLRWLVRCLKTVSVLWVSCCPCRAQETGTDSFSIATRLRRTSCPVQVTTWTPLTFTIIDTALWEISEIVGIGEVPNDSQMLSSTAAYSQGGSPNCYVAVRFILGSPKTIKLQRKL